MKEPVLTPEPNLPSEELLVLLTGLGLAYGGIIKVLAGELPVLGFLVFLNGVFLILVAIRSIRSRYLALEHRRE